MIKQALEKSDDDGDTLDLSRRDIDRIGEEAVEMFKSGVGKGQKGVWRLALSYNFLRDGSMVDSFSKLSRLRYLNLKGNKFTQFPHAITQMPALEILDFSKNELSSLPELPGHLVKLKVLSLTSNKIQTLPSYLVEFGVLKVFKVDQNPVDWPPTRVLGPLIESVSTRSKTSSAPGGKKKVKEEDLRPWIESMKIWMAQQTPGSENERRRGEEEAYLASEEEPSSATSIENPGVTEWPEASENTMVAPSSQATIRRTYPLRGDTPDLAFAQRNISTTFSEDSLLRSSSPSHFSPANHSRNASVSSFTSPPSASTDASFHSHSRNPSTNLPHLATQSVQGHTRGASYTPAQRNSGQLTAKKSLPDLRQSHAKIIHERRGRDSGEDGEGEGMVPVMAPAIVPQEIMGVRSPPHLASALPRRASRMIGRKASVDLLIRKMGEMTSHDMADRNASHDDILDESRNSYFRRLSTLPASSISKAIPPFLLKFIDSIRGILFALSQLHSSLRQYLVFAVNERVSSVFGRVMEPAGMYMNKLINALDRFDSMSRRGTPPTQAIQNLFDATKESVAVFGKVLAVLKMQVPAMRGNDARYTRTLMVNVYGAMAEVASSWKTMTAFLPEVKMLLFMDAPALGMRCAMGGHKMVASGSFTGRTPISPIIERRESHSPQSATLESSPPNLERRQQQQAEIDVSPTAHAERRAGVRGHGVGTERRHAGSYSSLDVERGMMMGSPLAKSMSIGVREDEGHKIGESGTIHLPPPDEEDEADEERYSSMRHMLGAASPQSMSGRTSQHRHRPTSSAGSSNALYLPPSLSHSSRQLSVDIRAPASASATLFDEDLLDVIDTATEAAFACWLKLSEEIGAVSPQMNRSTHRNNSSISSVSSQSQDHLDLARMALPLFTPLGAHSRRPSTISPKAHAELVHNLSVAEQITAALRESLLHLRADPHAYSYTTLPDDTQSFIKIVVKVSELVKAMSRTHAFPVSVRQAVGKLTQATRECAILIQVSSLKPGQGTAAPTAPLSSGRSVMPISRAGSATGIGTGYISSHHGPESSTDDLSHLHPPSSTGPSHVSTPLYTPSSSTTSFEHFHYTSSSSGVTTNASGLRDLQLPSRLGHASFGRNRSGNGSAQMTLPSIQMPVPYVNGGAVGQANQPRSAQASQVAF